MLTGRENTPTLFLTYAQHQVFTSHMLTVERKLITATEVARRLQCSHSTVVRQARTGQLPYVQRLDGRRGAYLFDPDVIAAIALERLDEQREAVRAMEESLS